MCWYDIIVSNELTISSGFNPLQYIINIMMNTSNYPIISIGTKNDIKLTALDITVLMWYNNIHNNSANLSPLLKLVLTDMAI